MIDLNQLFDSYGRQARLYPALITLLPLLFVVPVIFPHLTAGTFGPAALAAAAGCGLLYLIADFSRSRGRRAEKKLLALWGGWPTTLFLRHSTDFLPQPTKSRYHAFLASSVPGWHVPTDQQEASDPALADAAYASAVDWLRERCRQGGSALVDKENASYGFRRNMFGLKPTAVTLCIISALVVMVLNLPANVLELGWLDSLRALKANVATPEAAVLLADIGILAFLALVVSPDWVREAGNCYARALLATCDRA